MYPVFSLLYAESTVWQSAEFNSEGWHLDTLPNVSLDAVSKLL
jgi:hypothetical protein